MSRLGISGVAIDTGFGIGGGWIETEAAEESDVDANGADDVASIATTGSDWSEESMLAALVMVADADSRCA